MKFELRIIDLHWINGMHDAPDDFCLHGNVCVKIGDKTIGYSGNENEEWTVSTGAYRMLESLYSDHLAGREEHLLPCCGHFMVIDEQSNKLLIIGCHNGLDWSVIHEGDNVRLKTDLEIEVVIPFDDYQEIVFSFADAIKAYYNKSSPKTPPLEQFEKDAYQRFWSDWDQWRGGNNPLKY